MSSVDFSRHVFISDFHQRSLATVEVGPLACQTWTMDGTSYLVESSLSIKFRLHCLIFLSFLFDSVKKFLNDYLEDLAEKYRYKEDLIEGLKTFKDRRCELDTFRDELKNNMFALLSLKEVERGLHDALLSIQKWRVDGKDVSRLGGEWRRDSGSLSQHISSGRPASTDDCLPSLDSDPQHISAFSSHRSQTSALFSRFFGGKGKKELLCAQAKKSIEGIAACEPFATHAWIGAAQEASFPKISVKKVKETSSLRGHTSPLSETDEQKGGLTSKLFDLLLDHRGKPTCIPIAHLCRQSVGEVELRPIQRSTWILDERAYHITKSFRTDLSLCLLKWSAYFSSSSRTSLEQKLKDLSQEYEDRIGDLKWLCDEMERFVNQGAQIEQIQASYEQEIHTILSLKNQEEQLHSLVWFMKQKAEKLYSACQNGLTEGQKKVLQRVCGNPRSKLEDVAEIDELLSLLKVKECVQVLTDAEMERSLFSNYLADSFPTLARVRNEMTKHVGEAQRLIEELATIDLVTISSWLNVIRESHYPELSYRFPQRR